MYFLKSIIDFLIVLLLVRLLIRPVEANFNQIYSLIYRITDYILKPAKLIVRNDLKSVWLSVLGLVFIRGLLYFFLFRRITLAEGEGVSFLDIFQLLLRFYMVVWFITILTGNRAHTTVISVLQRGFLPLSRLSSRLRIPSRFFTYFSFLIILIIYSALSYLIHNNVSPDIFKKFPLYKPDILSLPSSSIIPLPQSFNFFHGIIEGLILIIRLFPLPGFFSLIIFVGALLSWVSPDPYNPIVQTIYGISEPLLRPFRKIIPPLGGLDVSPIIALFCFWIIGIQVFGLLRQLM